MTADQQQQQRGGGQASMEELIAATRELICQIGTVWSPVATDLTCADIAVEIHLPNFVTIRIGHIPRDEDDA